MEVFDALLIFGLFDQIHACLLQVVNLMLIGGNQSFNASINVDAFGDVALEILEKILPVVFFGTGQQLDQVTDVTSFDSFFKRSRIDKSHQSIHSFRRVVEDDVLNFLLNGSRIGHRSSVANHVVHGRKSGIEYRFMDFDLAIL